jgi:hypothetical protein
MSITFDMKNETVLKCSYGGGSAICEAFEQLINCEEIEKESTCIRELYKWLDWLR